jgi:site-specific recombinase XerD
MESQKNRSPIPHRKRGAITIEDAIAAFMASRSNRGIAAPTLNKYRTFVKQLRAYCDSRGYVLLDKLGVADMDRFYASWKDGNRSRAKKLERLKSFIKFCLKRKWLAEDIADDLRPPKRHPSPQTKKPSPMKSWIASMRPATRSAGLIARPQCPPGAAKTSRIS